MTPIIYLHGFAVILNFLLVIFLLSTKQRTKLQNKFTLFVFNIFLWVLFDFITQATNSATLANIWDRITNIFLPLIPLSLAVFVSEFARIRKNRKLITIGIGIPSTIFLLLNLFYRSIIVKGLIHTDSGTISIAGPLYYPYSIFISGSILICMLILSHLRHKDKTSERWQQAKYIIVALSAPLVFGALTEIILPSLNVEFYPLTAVLTSITALMIAYSTSHHKVIMFIKSKLQTKLIIAFTTFLFSLSLFTYIILEETSLLTTTNSIILLITQGLFLIIGVVIAKMFADSIVSPLKQLQEHVEELGKGNYDTKVLSETQDEIGSLAFAFNKMKQQLISQKQKIDMNQKNLEDTIDKRTQELQKHLRNVEHTKAALLNIMEDLQIANEHLKELDDAKSNFLNIVSHELKTPLTALIAHVEVLEDIGENLTEEENRSLMAVKRNAHALKTLIENILEIARIESDKFVLNIKNVDIAYVTKDIVKNLKVLADKKGLNIKVKMAKIGSIPCDEMRTREILNNLISNAIKYTEKGSITIEAKKEKNYLVISVTDTGIGIPKEKIDRLFQKFYQVEPSLSRKQGGTGLGLSITKQLVALQGGRITVESQPEKGSCFTFTIPLKQGVKK